jgi:hypothetical protein
MRTIKSTHVVAYLAALSMLTLPIPGLAQDDSGGPPPAASQQNPAPPGTWQHFANPPQNPGPPDPQNQPEDTATGAPGAPAPVIDMPPGQAAPNQQTPNQGAPNGMENDQQNESVPPQLRLKAGTFITVRSNQYLSSDKNQAGDAFTATIADPLVVDGFVVAAPGETVGGRVVEAKKAGMVKGVSHLALQLTSLTLVDGQTVPIQTQLSATNGPHSNGRDAAAMATTTGVGAAVGAAVAKPWDVGTGAAIGAGAGAAIGLAGVLLTRGRPTVVYPEGLLTFQIAAPVSISTVSAPQAFRYMDPNAYQASMQGPPPSRPGPPCNGYGCPPPPPYYYGYGPGYYPYYWGPGFAFGWGPAYYGGWGWYRGGWYRGGFYGRRR